MKVNRFQLKFDNQTNNTKILNIVLSILIILEVFEFAHVELVYLES